jgi:type IV secretory pathway VirB6-like protein
MQAPAPDLIDGLSTAFIEGGRALQLRIQPLAQNLMGGLLMLQMSWFGIQALLESLVGDHLGDVLARLLRLILLFGLVSWLLVAYDDVFYTAIYGGCTALIQALAGDQGESQSFATVWQVFIDLIMVGWHTMVDMPSHFLSGGNPGIWSFWSTLLILGTNLLLLIAILGTFVVCLVFVATVHVMGAALAGLALSLGPFFIPWLLWNPTRNLFESWLRFLLTACFYRVIAVTLMILAKPIFTSMQNMLTAGTDLAQSTNPLDTLMSMVGLLIVSSITAGMMVRVPQLASAMIGHAKIDIGLMNKVASGVHQAKEYVSPKKGRRNWVREEY